MIGKIKSILPNTKGEINLAHGDAIQAKEKKAKPVERPDGPATVAVVEAPTSNIPVHIRHLGKHLDLIG